MSKYSVGNRVLHSKYGEGMISNVKDNSLEVLFLNGGKLLFQLNDPEISLLSSLELSTPAFTQPQVINQTAISPNSNRKNEGEFTIGSRVMHHEYGEGMVTKVTKNEVEVIFLNDSKYNFLKNSGEITPLPTMISSTISPQHSLNTKIPAKPTMPNVGFNNGSRILHNTLGEGMITKTLDNNNVEIIFLDGSKRIFSKNSDEIKLLEVNISEINQTPNIQTERETNISENKNKPSENKLGNQVFHPKYGEGMVSKIHKNDYDVIFVDGNKMTLPKNEFLQKNNNSTLIANITEENKKADTPEISYINPLVGKQIFHKTHGDALLVGVGKDVFEVMLLDGKQLILPQNQFTDAVKEETFSDNKEKDDKSTLLTDIKEFTPYFERDFKKTGKKNPMQNSNSEKIEFSIGTIVLHPKHGEGIISLTDETEIEVVFKNNKKITYSKTNNELKIKPPEPKKITANIKTLYKKLFLIEDTINNNQKIENEVKIAILQEIKDVFSILDAKFQNCNEKQ